MKHSERGITGNSIMTFHIPSTNALEHLYFHNYSGIFYANSLYCIDRRHANFDSPYLLLLVQKGCLFLDYDGKKYAASSGQVLLFNCHRQHRYYAEGNTQFVFVHFGGCDSDFLFEKICGNDQYMIELRNYNEVNRCFNVLIALTDENIPNEYTISSYIYQLLILIITGKITNHTSDVQHQRVISTIEKMKSNLSDNLTVQGLAGDLGLTPTYLTRIFKLYTDQTPSEYLINLRMTHAKVLLSSTSYLITDIASLCGYPDTGYFIRLFKKKNGYTPLQYKKRHLSYERLHPAKNNEIN